ncbi:MAG: YceI family protein [Haliea sp.]
MIKNAAFALLMTLLAGTGFAADYVIDGTGAGMHSFVQFKASHVGISTMIGRFNDITGNFTYDADNIEASSISVAIDPASIDTNHPARDEHLRTSDYLDVERYPEAGFISTSFTDTGNGTVRISGDFTLHGVTREISIAAHRTGEGQTPFGDYRVGFEGTAQIDVVDFGINLLPDSSLELLLAIEGIRQ